MDVVAAVIKKNDQYLIVQRNKHKHLGLKWEFPGGKVDDGESFEEALQREIKEECGAMPKILKKIGTIKHAYTHFTISFHGYHCEENGTSIRCQQNSKWIKPNQIDKFPFPLDKIDSINKISPPTLVHAKPVTTPATSLFSYLSRCNLGLPKISTISSFVIFTLYASSIAIFFAA